MKFTLYRAFVLLALILATGAWAQETPPGVSVGQFKLGAVYVDSRGMTLYALNQQQTRSRSGVTLKYCIGPCAELWTPLAASAGASPIGAWTAVDGAQGPQWSYKGNLVFTSVKDTAPGSAAADGADDLWKVIVYIPPVPAIRAPAAVAPLFVDSAYILTDGQGHALYTVAKGTSCSAACAAATPLLAGLASQGVGDWTVARDGDHPQWSYRGQRVFVSQEVGAVRAPAGGTVLLP